MSFTTSFGQHEAKPILQDFESLGLLSGNCFDLLVKKMVRMPMFDEVNYHTSILKIGHLPRYQ
jgi:hypothetical protein